MLLEFWGICSKKYRSELDKIIRQLHLHDRIKIMGPSNSVYEEMQRSKAIIVASRCEGFGRITAEAMLNKCLVIGKNTGGTKEQFDNGLSLMCSEIGLRFNTTQELESAIITLGRMKREDYEKITKDAKATVERLYSVDQNVQATLELLNSIEQPIVTTHA